jgi:hypothetical protein
VRGAGVADASSADGAVALDANSADVSNAGGTGVASAGGAHVSNPASVEVLKERIARALCPVEDHDGPCEVPWGFTLADDSDDLLLGIYSSAEKATEVFARVKAVADGRPVELTEGEPDRFEDLATQYRIAHER